MKTHSKKLTAVAFMAMLAMATLSTNAKAQGIYAGVKAGKALITAFDDFPSLSNKEGPAFGFNLGYEFTETLSVELEYVKGDSKITGGIRDATLDISTFAAYGTFRSYGDLYFLGRIGIVSYKLGSNISNIIPDSTDTGLTLGGGIGYRVLPNLSIELDYTIVEADTNWLLLSAKYYLR